jgi:hypothetical protein
VKWYQANAIYIPGETTGPEFQRVLNIEENGEPIVLDPTADPAEIAKAVIGNERRMRARWMDACAEIRRLYNLLEIETDKDGDHWIICDEAHRLHFGNVEDTCEVCHYNAAMVIDAVNQRPALLARAERAEAALEHLLNKMATYVPGSPDDFEAAVLMAHAVLAAAESEVPE